MLIVQEGVVIIITNELSTSVPQPSRSIDAVLSFFVAASLETSHFLKSLPLTEPQVLSSFDFAFKLS